MHYAAQPDPHAAYLALSARDARFDGHWFVGVLSTGVYCRPICRVRLPRAENCRFFNTCAQAEAAGFRPCLKCRPEIAPGRGHAWTVMDASRTLAQQATQLMGAPHGTARGGVVASSVRGVAQHLGISERHLRRIFSAEHGTTPRQYLQTQRLLLAKQLLTDTTLSVAQVAAASGFASTRRFNAVFSERYRLAPSRLRRNAAAATHVAAPNAIELRLAYRAPYDTARLLRFMVQHTVPGTECIDGLRIQRSVRAGLLHRSAGWIEVEFVPLRAQVLLRFAPEWLHSSACVVTAVRRWLDLDAAPHAIDSVLSQLPGNAGLRLPGSIDAFELAVRAVLGQQVTVAGACTLAGRLVQRFGAPLVTPWAGVHLSFPAPEALAGVVYDRIAELGIISSRARAIVALAQSWPQITAHIDMRQSPQQLIAVLCALPGIGPWTANYIAMRALGWPDTFLPNDVALLKAMARQFGTSHQRDADALAEQWRPWRSYAVLRLWNSLETPE